MGRRWPAVAMMTLAACTSSGGSETSLPPVTTTTTAGAVEPVTNTVPADDHGDTAPPESVEPPLFEGLPGTVTLLTATFGGGIRPRLEWEPVDGADYYSVFLYAPSGRVYWGWAGRATGVHVGGEPQIREDGPGASIIDGMSWAVLAYDSASLPIAVSPQRPIAP
jgi:hypothetical protein